MADPYAWYTIIWPDNHDLVDAFEKGDRRAQLVMLAAVSMVRAVAIEAIDPTCVLCGYPAQPEPGAVVVAMSAEVAGQAAWLSDEEAKGEVSVAPVCGPCSRGSRHRIWQQVADVMAQMSSLPDMPPGFIHRPGHA